MLRTVSARGSYTRQEVLTDDGGTLGLDWWNGADRRDYTAPDAPILFIIHGINGGSHEGYCKWSCISAAGKGWRPVVLNLRGCNGLPMTSTRGYNAILTHDLHVALTSITSRFPGAPVLAAGYSLGSVLLAKYVAEADWGLHGGDGGGSGLVAAALVSPPVCIHSTNTRLRQPGPPFLYNMALAYKLREYIRGHLPAIRAHGGTDTEMQQLLGAWTCAQFDEVVTTKHLGYSEASDYYRHACSTNYLPYVRTPTLVVTALDDPFLGVLPVEACSHNPFTGIVATRHGGHLGFLHGLWPLGPSYCDALVADLLDAALGAWRAAAPSRAWEARAAAVGLGGGAGSTYVVGTLAGALCGCVEQQQEAAAAPVGGALPWFAGAVSGRGGPRLAAAPAPPAPRSGAAQQRPLLAPLPTAAAATAQPSGSSVPRWPWLMSRL